MRLSHSKKIIFSVLKLARSLNRTAYDKQLSPLQKILIPLKAREMLKTFEIGLKYIPQMYFETLKLLRHLWYLYQMQIIMITEE